MIGAMNDYFIAVFPVIAKLMRLYRAVSLILNLKYTINAAPINESW